MSFTILIPDKSTLSQRWAEGHEVSKGQELATPTTCSTRQARHDQLANKPQEWRLTSRSNSRPTRSLLPTRQRKSWKRRGLRVSTRYSCGSTQTTMVKFLQRRLTSRLSPQIYLKCWVRSSARWMSSAKPWTQRSLLMQLADFTNR